MKLGITEEDKLIMEVNKLRAELELKKRNLPFPDVQKNREVDLSITRIRRKSEEDVVTPILLQDSYYNFEELSNREVAHIFLKPQDLVVFTLNTFNLKKYKDYLTKELEKYDSKSTKVQRPSRENKQGKGKTS